MEFPSLHNPQDHARQNYIAGLLTLGIALIAITPLCGFLFACGCAWPWEGLDSGCNFYQPDAVHKCPWCASRLSGWLSAGLSIGAGVYTACRPLPLLDNPAGIGFLPRIIQGLLIFVCVAALTAALAAGLQNYAPGILPK